MNQAIPYSRNIAGSDHRRRLDNPSPPQAIASSSTGDEEKERISKAIAQSPVVVIGRRGCYMCHVIRLLLQGLGVNPAICEVGEGADVFGSGEGVEGGDETVLPAVFIAGRLVGGLDKLMAVHISGELVPTLKEAGALWL